VLSHSSSLFLIVQLSELPSSPTHPHKHTHPPTHKKKNNAKTFWLTRGSFCRCCSWCELWQLTCSLNWFKVLLYFLLLCALYLVVILCYFACPVDALPCSPGAILHLPSYWIWTWDLGQCSALFALADKSWLKVLFSDLLWEKNTAEWLSIS